MSRKDFEVELINLADKKVAFADGRPPDQYNDDTAAIIESVRAAKGVIVASPVYRGSFTGALKNVLDHLPVESLAGKPVGIVAMGATQHHYLGVDWHLRDVLAWFGGRWQSRRAFISRREILWMANLLMAQSRTSRIWLMR